MGKFESQSKWLWNDKEVQEDLLMLQKKYKELGFDFSLEDCYNLWYFYSETASANWMNVGNINSISNSLKYAKYITLK